MTDLASTVSDALDQFGVGGAIPAHILRPVGLGQRICGPAITIRYVPVGGSPGALYARDARPLLADRDLYQIGEARDVAVFDSGGARDISVMGGLSATWARRVGIEGCIVDGGIRDIDYIREIALPVWSSGRTPITGRHRMEAVEINGTVAIAGAQVRPGDLIVADGSGVCVVPAEWIERVLERCEESAAAERDVVDMMGQGLSSEEITRRLPIEKW